MGFIIAITVLFLLLFGGGLFTISYLKRVRLNADLKRNIESGANDKTLRSLLDLIIKEPFNIKYRLQAADLLFSMNNFSEAVVQLNGALSSDPPLPPDKETQVHIKLAESYKKLGQLDDALGAYIRAAKLSPQQVEIHMDIARVHIKKKQKNNAIRAMQTAIGIDPENIAILKEFGRLLHTMRKFKEALAIFKKVQKTDRNDTEVHFYLGDLMYRFKKPEEAIEHFLMARYDPKLTVKSMYSAGQILRELGNMEEAVKVLGGALEIKGLQKEHMLSIRYALGEIHLSQNDFQNAILQWEHILKMVPDYKDVRMKLEKYELTKSNQTLRKYMMSSPEDFITMCRKIAKRYTGTISLLREERRGDGTVEIAAQVERGGTSMTAIFKFFRGSGSVGALALREFYETIKERNARLGICYTSSEFSEEAVSFSQGRILELYQKNDFIRVLTRAVK